VLRLLTPLKMSYEAAKKRAEPYTKIVEELPEMRRDTVELVTKAVAEKRKAYVLVNDRSEGNAPLTIQACGMSCRPRRRERCLFRSLSFYRFPLPLFRDVQMTTPAFRAAPSSGPSAVASASPVRTATSR